MTELILILLGGIFGVSVAWFVFRARHEALRRESEREYELRVAQFPAAQQETINSLEMQLANLNHENTLKLTQAVNALQTSNSRDLGDLKAEFQTQERIIRQKSVSASRRTLVGKFIERFVPFLEHVKYEPADMHFLGNPVDYIVFNGLHEDQVREVVFLEVKTGNSALNKRERSLRDAVAAGSVRWQELRIDVASDANPNIAAAGSTPAMRELYEKIDTRILEPKSSVAKRADEPPAFLPEDPDDDVTCKVCRESFRFLFTDEELKHGRRIKCPRCAGVAAYSYRDL